MRSAAIREAFPDLEPVFGGQGAYGGHRAPRDHTISFRLRDARGKYRSNVVWVLPEHLGSLTPGDIHTLVARANGGAPQAEVGGTGPLTNRCSVPRPPRRVLLS